MKLAATIKDTFDYFGDELYKIDIWKDVVLSNIHKINELAKKKFRPGDSEHGIDYLRQKLGDYKVSQNFEVTDVKDFLKNLKELNMKLDEWLHDLQMKPNVDTHGNIQKEEKNIENKDNLLERIVELCN